MGVMKLLVEKNGDDSQVLRTTSMQNVMFADFVRHASGSFPAGYQLVGNSPLGIRVCRSDRNVLQVVFKITAVTTEHAICHACRILVDCFDALRICFDFDSQNNPIQRVNESSDVSIKIFDLSEQTQDSTQQFIDRFVIDDCVDGFRVLDSQLIRFAFFQLERNQWQAIFTIHHLIIDMRSIPELLKAFCCILGGDSLVQNSNYVSYLSYLEGTRTNTIRLEQWQKSLNGSGAIGMIATPESDERFVHSKIESSKLTAAETQELWDLVGKFDLSMTSILEAAWAVVLSRHTRQDRVLWGSTRSHRPQELFGSQDMVGLLINTLPVQADLNSFQNVDDLIRDIRQQHLALRNLMHVNQLSLIREKGKSLFESLVVYDRQDLADCCQDLPISDIAFYSKPSVPLVLECSGTECLKVGVRYWPELIEDQTAQTLLDHIKALLLQLKDSIDGKVFDWSMQTSDESDFVIQQNNETDCEFPSEKCIYEWFEASVQKTPDAIAVQSSDSLLTYEQVDQRANHITAALAKNGYKGGDKIAVLMKRDCNLIPSLLGALKAGCVYVPFDDSWPVNRIQNVLEKHQIRCMLVSSDKLNKVSDIVSKANVLEHVFSINPLRDEAGQFNWPSSASFHQITLDDHVSSEPVDVNVISSEPAYIIFTSGTTGEPKGVQVSHRSVSNLIDWVNREFMVTPQDKLLFVTSLCFDLSVYDIFGILAAGGTIRIASEIERSDPDAMIQILADEKITFWDSAPAFIKQLFLAGKQNHVEQFSEALRLVFLSGDWIPLDLPKQIIGGYPNADVISLGGATEATVWSNYYRVTHQEARHRSIPYGRPIQNAKYYILDQSMKPCAINEPGELYIAGECVAMGYAADYALTEQRFLTCPFDSRYRMYKTGDLARWRPDAQIEILGRIDNQVKIRGYRIELGEIESVLRKHESITNCAVCVQKNDDGDQCVVAYVVLDDSGENQFDKTQIMNFLAGLLPQYMLPSRLICVSHVPLNSNGKVDPVQLKNHVVKGGQDYSQQSPRTSVESQLHAIWSEILGIGQFGIDDSFFDLGGDSLQVFKVVLKAESVGLCMTPKMLFQYQTIARIAEAMKTSAIKLCSKSENNDNLPLLPSQRWFFERGIQRPQFYNVAFLYQFHTEIMSDKFMQAAETLLRRHESLRLTFEKTTDGWKQAIGHFEIHEIAESVFLNQYANLTASIQTIAYDLRKQMDIDNGPLVKLVLIQCGSNKPYLLAVMHHLVFDSVSFDVLNNDLQSLIQHDGDQCRHLFDGRYPNQSYTSVCRELGISAKTKTLHDHAGHWLEVPWELAESLPAELNNGSNTYSSSSVQSVHLSLGSHWDSVSQPEFQIDEILLRAMGGAFCHAFDVSHFLVDYTSHGRDVDLEVNGLPNVFGYLTCVAPLLIDVLPNLGNEDPYVYLHQTLELARTQSTTFGLLKYLADSEQIQSAIRKIPQPSIKFNYHGKYQPDEHQFLKPIDMKFAGVMPGDEERFYQFNIEAYQTDKDRLLVEIKYSRNVYSDALIKNLLRQLKDQFQSQLSVNQTKEAIRTS